MRFPREWDQDKGVLARLLAGRLFLFAQNLSSQPDRPDEAGLSSPEILMKKLKLVMIGNGMAGVRTLEELLKLSNELYDITVFGAEPHTNYNRILLSPVLAGEQTFEEIVLNDLSWYLDNDIKLLLNRKAVQIDRVKRRVI